MVQVIKEKNERIAELEAFQLKVLQEQNEA
jgi:hypothetical protein